MDQLLEGRYEAISNSLAFPILTSEVLTESLTRSQSEGQNEALEAFEEWLRGRIWLSTIPNLYAFYLASVQCRSPHAVRAPSQ